MATLPGSGYAGGLFLYLVPGTCMLRMRVVKILSEWYRGQLLMNWCYMITSRINVIELDSVKLNLLPFYVKYPELTLVVT